MGALPVREGTTISAAICVDPSKVVALVNRYGLQEVCCGLWSDIQQALEESDLLGCVKKKRDAITIDLQLQTIARKALEVIFEEVEKHGDPSQTPRTVQLKKVGATYEYNFNSKDGSRAAGSIDPRLWQALVAVVFQSRDRGDFKVHSGTDGTLHLTLDTRVPFDAQVNPSVLPLNSDESLVAAVPQRERLILLIEDNSTFASVIARFLSRHGMRTIHCPDGEAACQLLQAGQVDPQLIMCDVHMPRMNGVEFVTRLRALERFKSVPTLVLTSDIDTELELEVLRVGADLLLPKTVDPRILCAHAERLMFHGERSLEVKVA
jgi:CheY-like chemotaxis protein